MHSVLCSVARRTGPGRVEEVIVRAPCCCLRRGAIRRPGANDTFASRIWCTIDYPPPLSPLLDRTAERFACVQDGWVRPHMPTTLAGSGLPSQRFQSAVRNFPTVSMWLFLPCPAPRTANCRRLATNCHQSVASCHRLVVRSDSLRDSFGLWVTLQAPVFARTHPPSPFTLAHVPVGL